METTEIPDHVLAAYIRDRKLDVCPQPSVVSESDFFRGQLILLLVLLIWIFSRMVQRVFKRRI